MSRRSFLRAGALAAGGIAGLTLPQLLALRASGAVAESSRHKAVIMVYLNGGPSHMDMYDMKPEAPAEYRGEFSPIRTNVPGLDICELFPQQAKIADKLAIVRNMKFLQQGHTPPELFTGFLQPRENVNGNRPAMGSIISKLRSDAGVRGPLPPFVYIGDTNYISGPSWLGKAHEAFVPGSKTSDLELAKGVSVEQVADRRTLLKQFDRLKREVDTARGSLQGIDAFTERALEMVTTNLARDAFDVSQEPEKVREKYGKGKEYLQARRLVEAGVPFVTITPQNHGVPKECNGQWDHHDHIFKCLRHVLPQLDQSLSALITDLVERGMEKDVAVCVWGEMGRTPRVGTQMGTVAGRDHWPQSGFCLLACGGLSTGQVVGATDRRGELPAGRPYTPQNVLATLYHVLGIDPATTLPDLSGRPIYLLDDQRKIREVV